LEVLSKAYLFNTKRAASENGNKKLEFGQVSFIGQLFWENSRMMILPFLIKVASGSSFSSLLLIERGKTNNYQK
jgi:hypothetical protein